MSLRWLCHTGHARLLTTGASETSEPHAKAVNAEPRGTPWYMGLRGLGAASIAFENPESFDPFCQRARKDSNL
jgi:hypothetical protein